MKKYTIKKWIAKGYAGDEVIKVYIKGNFKLLEGSSGYQLID